MTVLAFLKLSHIIVSLLLIAIVLIQNKNASLNLATMSSGMNGVTKRGPEKVLHITTIILGALFILLGMAFFILY